MVTTGYRIHGRGDAWQFPGPLGGGSGSRTLVGEKESLLNGPTQTVEFIYRPQQPGRIHLVAEVDRLPGEVSREKNLAHGEISVFMGRMLPVVRHLISIPAGIARMSLNRFVLFTGLGALVWCA